MRPRLLALVIVGSAQAAAAAVLGPLGLPAPSDPPTAELRAPGYIVH